MRRSVVLSSLLGGLICPLGAEGAVSFSISGLAGTGVTADVSFSYQSVSDTAANIVVSITNTTAASIGGFVTGFAFNVPTIMNVSFNTIGGDADNVGMQTTTALVAPNEAGWWARLDPGNIKTPNAAGDFDFGVLNQSQPNPFVTGGVGSGSGVIIGETTNFTLGVTGMGLDDLTNASFEQLFMAELSTGGTAGAFSFGARFQGLSNGGSDFAVRPPTSIIPVPSAALLALLGLGGTGLLARRAK